MGYYKANTSLPEHWGMIVTTDYHGVERRSKRWMAYEGADTLDDFRQAWKRTRTWKCGIAHLDAYRIEPTKCYNCGKLVTQDCDPSDRPYVEWKRGWSDLRVKHYKCAWQSTMEQVATLSDYI
jgi:hypothetical protein